MEKEYKVLAYRDSVGNTLTLYSDGKYKVHPDAYILAFNESECLSEGFVINSIQRVYDNEVFSVGDIIETIYKIDGIKPRRIERIEIDDCYSGGVALLQEEGVGISILIAKHKV